MEDETTKPEGGKDGIADMIKMNRLTEETILQNLKIRYEGDKIYTWIGNVLVAVNPYQILSIFTKEKIANFQQTTFENELKPHIFATAKIAHYQLTSLLKSQSILISGESGSGKTESTKLILQYLAAISSKQSKIEQKILEINPILEAFGNAKTIRNNNSSRFGKFIGVYFGNEGIVGANIVQYLLEKSRVVGQAPNERNYHVFYQLCAGVDDEEKENLCLDSANHFNYLKGGTCTSIPGVDDADEYESLKDALSCLDIDEGEQFSVFKILSAILHIGEIVFELKQGTDDHVKIENPEKLKIIAKLLELDEAKLLKAFTERTIDVQSQKLIIAIKYDQAIDNRDTLAKTLYGQLFQWLVQKINSSLSLRTSKTFIGILDIFGFENFQKNSFEQFCINYANEKLQQFFNQEIFKLEQIEYQKEGINWSDIEFADNQECLNLIEKRPLGILSILDEECRFPKATDDTLLKKLHFNHEKHSNYKIPKLIQNTFAIEHYAGQVNYNVVGFLEKNKHSLQQDLINLFLASKNSLISQLLVEKEENNTVPTGTLRKTERNLTIASQFKKQLDELMNVLSSTTPNFVRCIKPNTLQIANTFDSATVGEQLHYLGILQTVKIRQMGYSMRFTFEEFWHRYRVLAKKVIPTKDNKNNFDRLIKELTLIDKQWILGKTKIFLKTTQHKLLESQREKELYKKIVLIQKIYKGYTYRSYYNELRKATILAQSLQRKRLARKKYLKICYAALILTSFARMLKQKKAYKKLRLALYIQTAFRGYIARKQYTQLLEQKKKAEEERRRKEEEERRRKAEEERRRREEEERRRKAEEEERLRKEEEERRRKIQQEKEEAKRKEMLLQLEREKEERRKKELERRRKEEEERKRKEEEERKRKEEEEEKKKREEAERKRKEEEKKKKREEEDKIKEDLKQKRDEEERKKLEIQEALLDLQRAEEERELNEKLEQEKLANEVKLKSKQMVQSQVDFTEHNLAIRKTARNKAPQESSPPLDPKASISDIRASKMTGNFSNVKVATLRGTVKPGTLNVNISSTIKNSKNLTKTPSLSKISVASNQASTLREHLEKIQTPVFVTYRRNVLGEALFSLQKNKDTSLIQSVPELITPEEVSKFLLFNFAQKNYQIATKGTLRKKSTEPQELMKFSKNKLKTSLLKLPPDLKDLALVVWDMILIYMRFKSSPFPILEAAETIIYLGIHHAQLRNEIYCQVIRQLIANPHEESVHRGWELLAYCCSTFPPNHHLLKFVASWLYGRTTNIGSPFEKASKFCMERLKCTVFYGARNLVPSRDELEAIRLAQPYSVQVVFMDGFQVEVQITPETVVAEVFAQATKSVGIQNTQSFALYEVSNDLERSLREEENLGDLIAKWEQYRQIVSNKGISVEYNFVIKKQLYLDSQIDSIDPVEYDLMYHQYVANILRGAWRCKSKEQAITLGSLQLLYEQDLKAKDINQILEEIIEQYVPRTLVRLHKASEWVQLLKQEATKFQQKNKDAIQKEYSNLAKSTFLFGSSVFQVQNRSINTWEDIPSAFTLVLNQVGMQFVKQDSNDILRFFLYDQITETIPNPKDAPTSFKLLFDRRSIVGAKEIEIQSIQTAEIVYLISRYIEEYTKEGCKFARAKIDSGTKVTDLKGSEQLDYRLLLSFKKDDIIAVENMGDQNWFLGVLDDKKGMVGRANVQLLRIDPRTLINQTEVEKRSLMRDSSEDLLRERSQGKFEVDKPALMCLSQLYTSGKFRKVNPTNKKDFVMEERISYSHEPIQSSLLTLSDNLNRIAVDIFLNILRYIGELPNVNSPFEVVQKILKECITYPELGDELYVQLCKQSTNNKERDKSSAVWELIAFTVASFPPSDQLLSTLEKHIEATTTDETNSGHLAMDAKVLLAATVKKHVRRAQPLSFKELEAIKYHHPLKVEIGFADVFCVKPTTAKILVDPSMTLNEALVKLVQTIGLKQDAGFSFFQTLEPGFERPLKEDQYFGDTLFLFEKSFGTNFKLQENLIFKKRLNYAIMEKPTDTIELDLGYAEALSTYIHGRSPVSEELCTSLAGLQLQINFGDYVPTFTEFNEKTLSNYIPKSYLAVLNFSGEKEKKWVEAIKLYWATSLSGLSIAEAKMSFLEAMKQWSLFGSSFFPVESRKPKNVLIAINKDGFFILNNGSPKKEVVSSFGWTEINQWRAENDTFILIAGSLVKLKKFVFHTKHASVLNTIFEEFLNLMVELKKKQKNSPNVEVRPPTAQELVLEERARRRSARMSTTIQSGSVRMKARPTSVLYKDFNFETQDLSEL